MSARGGRIGRRAMLAAVAALAGCTSYARVSQKNAPGLTDLSKPLERENGDPQRYEPAREPGMKTLTVFANPSVMIGAGRRPLPAQKAAFEPGLELRFEHHTARAGDREPFAPRALAVTAGIGFAQLVDGRSAIAGPLYAELNYRFLVRNSVPMDIGLGPVVYPSEFEAGGQLTARFLIIAVRARYLPDSGYELWGGFQLPIPFFFERSR
jgi:hypothetical protein